ncbi:MAG: SecD/SecF fusion protein [Gaiellaceae bacterium]|jgi:SecD/SecF fusion protein|nr:SecD/SecF fusion protein [Gaiellaceae bacterium]
MHERRSHLILVGLILAALAGVALLAIPSSPFHKKIHEGLDLQGGLEVVLRAVPPKGKPLPAGALDKSQSIMQTRVDKLGVSEPEIRKQGKDQIVIQLAGVHNIDQAAKIIGKTAQLELYDFETSLVAPSVDVQGNPRAEPNLYALLARVQSQAKTGTPSQYFLFSKKKLVAGPQASKQALLASKSAKRLGSKAKVFAVPQNTVVVTCVATNGCLGSTQPASTYFYLFKHDLKKGVPQMTGGDLSLGGIRADIDTQGGRGNIVRLSFTGKGNKKFHAITREEAIRGQRQKNFNTSCPDPNCFQHFAIVLDNVLQSTPYIDYGQNPNGIDPTGGGAEISNIATLGEAKDLALVLQTGALPVKFVTIERSDVSATLGKDSLQQAKRAALVGLLLVAIFLLLLYRFLGLVAVIGLGIYAAFLYAAILMLGVTLTLPGFAGLVLTIGVAADANVVVFERIKEEVRAGKSVRAAISAGYGKGFRTILDANVVTCITALVLFAVATAQVKGFALMLLIGTVISLVTAVAATRAMLGLLAGFRWFDNPKLMGAHGTQSAKWLQIDFMRRRYLWFAISGAIVLIGAVSLGVKGLNLGIDFKGGSQITFVTAKSTPIESVRSQAAAIGQRDAIVQGKGPSTNNGNNFKQYQVRTRALTPTQLTVLRHDLTTRIGAEKLGVNTVSASFGRQIARSAILAIIFSLLLIVAYIAIRFDIKYAVPVIIAMVHDIAITVGIYSLVGREVTTSTVAAVLTVLGYSIYDTIIIFDRIRENIPLMRRSPMASIVNVSLWETIRRSLATTFITLLPVASLLVFGGATLKDFAFALLVGIASGAYSSIFVAAPLLGIWKEREPEYARRIGREDTEPEDGGDGGRPAKRRPLRPRGGPALDPGTLALEEAEQAAAAEPTPSFGEFSPTPSPASASAKRERRRERRRARPHGRPR